MGVAAAKQPNSQDHPEARDAKFRSGRIHYEAHDTKFGKEGNLISSLTFVIFVPFVVSHCSRTLRVGSFRETIMH